MQKPPRLYHVHTEIGFSHGWISENPKLFGEAVFHALETYPVAYFTHEFKKGIMPGEHVRLVINKKEVVE
jgi:hypothetical protein